MLIKVVLQNIFVETVIKKDILLGGLLDTHFKITILLIIVLSPISMRYISTFYLKKVKQFCRKIYFTYTQLKIYNKHMLPLFYLPTNFKNEL